MSASLAALVATAPRTAFAVQHPPGATQPTHTPSGGDYQQPPPAWGTQPPPEHPPPAPSASPYTPTGYPHPGALAAYETTKKSQGLALVLEFLIPGVGSIYGDHAVGALVTWGAMIGGIVLIVNSIDFGHHHEVEHQSDGDGVNRLQFSLGIAALLGGRIFGLVDSWRATGASNGRLRASLGLPLWLDARVVPLRTEAGLVYAPALRLTF